MNRAQAGRNIILFDGICNFCNGAVNFIIKQDVEEKFLFTSLQSESGQKYLTELGLPVNHFDSFVYIDTDCNKYYTKSTAALYVAKELRKPWKLLFPFIIIPQPIRDYIYDFVAKNRYRWFGEKQECMIPTPDVKRRFLD